MACRPSRTYTTVSPSGVRNWNKPVNEDANQSSQTGVRIPPPPLKKKRKMIILAIEDFILLFVFFALINCSVGAYLQYKQDDDTDYAMTSYFTWFFLWWIILPRTVIKFVNSKFK